jgi:hypothetical protein
VGGSIAPDAPDAVEDILLCRVELLCRRSSEPVLAGRVPFVPRPVTGARPSSDSIASRGRFSGTMLCSPAILESNWKSLDAVAILLARSSKLGDGKKSYVPLKFSSTAPFPPNEKRE